MTTPHSSTPHASTPHSPNHNPTVEILPPERPRRLRRALFVTAIAAAAGLTGAFANSAFSQGFGPGFGPPWRAGSSWSQPFDPAAVEDRADRMVRHLSIEVDATPEQQERLRGIVRSAVRDLMPLCERAMNSRQRARELLTQTTIDRSAIEALRAEQMALADQATRRFTQALGDAASVLNPEQRRKLAERMDRFRTFHRGWHRG
ncbi:MAG: Spy/CpxP family protein refolding chaperone [Xanthobacteraceae bacterium]|nr:Spy/CpxP family protein refolding chaperone [Xanthobacteraceae bacterium]